MRPHHLLLALLLTALLGSCASMNQTECLNADWYAIGRIDGEKGASRDEYQRHSEACAKHAIVPDKTAYQEGYDHGIEDFCTPANGYENGRKGYNYKGACPADLEGSFLLGYQQGKAMYEAQQRVAEYDNAIQERAQRVSDIRYQIYRYEEILASRDATEQERQAALLRIRYLQRDTQYLRREIYDLQYGREDAARQLMELERQGVQGW